MMIDQYMVETLMTFLCHTLSERKVQNYTFEGTSGRNWGGTLKGTNLYLWSFLYTRT